MPREKYTAVAADCLGLLEMLPQPRLIPSVTTFYNGKPLWCSLNGSTTILNTRE
ncbi:hypothetical protein STEG23_019437, partial [Scotinomys teguina]